MSRRRAPAQPPTAELHTQIAVRAHVPRTRPAHKRRHVPEPELVLVLDTETTTDQGQGLLFGSYRVYTAAGRLTQEGVFHADDLGEADLAVLRQYVADHSADNAGHLRLRSRRDFLRGVFWPIAYRARARVVAFNWPWDASRLTWGWAPARNGGFVLRLFDSVDADGRLWPDRYRPNLRIKSLGSKRSFPSFVAPAALDDHLRDDGHIWPGQFLDLHTLAYAFTDRSLSLDAAAEEFGLAGRKDRTEEHGVITPAYIDYNRQDVRLTWELYQALIAEWRRHPIELAPEQAYSPAAVAKGYLRELGITPPIARSDVPVARLGQAMAGYYGGRTECRIRAVPMPVRYVDFASMYPTCFALLRLWPWLTAARLTAVDATADAQALVADLTRERLHDPAAWPALAGVFCRVRPRGELLPTRARYGALEGEGPELGAGSAAWTIGLNRLVADTDLWYPLADLLAAKLLGETAPEILEAFRIEPVGRLSGLRPRKLRGTVAVDPAGDDLFRLATEERARVKKTDKRLAQFLKTLANGGAYGIGAEYRQLEPVRGGTVVQAYGLWAMAARVATPEEPGEYCFPPLAATITGTARLLLGLAQADIEARGGTYVACDTDSLLVVASETGGLLACPGGDARLSDGTAAVKALSWAEVADVLAGINALNPFAAGTVADLVKLEPENFAPGDETRPVELHALALSSKRYVLYNRTPARIVVRKASEHGLGLYRPPVAESDDWKAKRKAKEKAWAEWVEVVWRRVIGHAEGRDPGPEPDWFALPAVSHLPVSSPLVLAPFRDLNAARPYPAQVKPFGFMTFGHLDPLAALPAGLTRGAVTPVAPYSTKPDELLALPWLNRYDGAPLTVTTRARPRAGEVRLQTIGDVVREYRGHPETKSGDPRGGLGRRGTVGLLPRLTVHAVGLPLHIGKESNRLEEVEDGVVTDPDDVYVTYRDERAEWTQALPALRRLRDEKGWRFLAEASRLSERALRYALNGGMVPRREGRMELLRLVGGA